MSRHDIGFDCATGCRDSIEFIGYGPDDVTLRIKMKDCDGAQISVHLTREQQIELCKWMIAELEE